MKDIYVGISYLQEQCVFEGQGTKLLELERAENCPFGQQKRD